VSARVLVAGVGNALFGDDGFGLAVIERLAGSAPLPGVKLMSAGIRGFDLASALLDIYDGAILVDAMSRGNAPGTLYVLSPHAPWAGGTGGPDPDVDAGAFEPGRALGLARGAGARVSWLRVVGCERSPLAGMTMSLSPPVENAVEQAAELVLKLVSELRSEYWVDA
jgi:hydrogenase maturation protease